MDTLYCCQRLMDLCCWAERGKEISLQSGCTKCHGS
ncbi:hypothetical protein AOLI_G00090450 [Acnodon oligacanthus]